MECIYVCMYLCIAFPHSGSWLLLPSVQKVSRLNVRRFHRLCTWTVCQTINDVQHNCRVVNQLWSQIIIAVFMLQRVPRWAGTMWTGSSSCGTVFRKEQHRFFSLHTILHQLSSVSTVLWVNEEHVACNGEMKYIWMFSQTAVMEHCTWDT